MVSGHDCGKVVNPTTGEGQIEGGVVQGLGYALTEEHHLKDGRILNDQFSTYIIPTPMDVPEIQSLIVEHEYPWGPYGAKGLGETPDHRGGPGGHRPPSPTPPACASTRSPPPPSGCGRRLRDEGARG